MHDFSHRILLREEGRLLRARDRGFESTFLQRRVCEPPVPQLAPGDHVRRLAQFEHEVIGERIRDKIAASKSKGMWMGGVPPFGYRAQDRKLIIVDSEAEIVRFIYRRYAELGSVRLLKDELEARGIRSKLRTSASGRISGGKPFARGALYLMLQNRIYRGEIVHREQSHLGEHEPIIYQPSWAWTAQRWRKNSPTQPPRRHAV